MGLLLDRPEDSTDKLMCKPASLDHCLKQPNPGAVVASAQLVPTNAVKSRQSVAFEVSLSSLIATILEQYS